MKTYSIAVLMAVVLAASAALVLSNIQETAAQAFSKGSARLDYQEGVNFYGREDPSVYDR